MLVEGTDYTVWVANRGLPEYELLDLNGQAAVAVTLHRAVGMLSVADGRIRRCQAGPSVPTPGAQCQGTIAADLAFGFSIQDRFVTARTARAWAHPAEAVELPHFPYVEGTQELARTSSFVAVEPAAVALSACKPAADGVGIILRLVNLAATPTEAILTLGFPVTHWCRTDLAEARSGEPTLVEAQRVSLTLAPHEIATLWVGNV